MEKVYEAFVRIIERELSCDRNNRIIIDITSTTKEGAIAASLIGQLYDIKISYVPKKEKEKWIASFSNPRDFLKIVEPEYTDAGAEYLQYGVRASPLAENEILALEQMTDKTYDSMNEFISDIGKKLKNSKETVSQRYWARLLHNLEDQGLVVISNQDAKTRRVSLSPLGDALIKGRARSSKR